MTGFANGASCDKFAQAEAGTVWNRIFKNHMKLEESCIGIDNAKKLMEGSNDLFATYYYSYGQDPCSSVSFSISNSKLKIFSATFYNSIMFYTISTLSSVYLVAVCNQIFVAAL